MSGGHLQLSRVSRRYSRSVLAVDNVSLTVTAGEFVVLVGPSGCGKSTLLRMVAGLEGIDDGDILLDERSVAHASPRDRDVAMIFQNYALYPHLTVAENIALPLRLRGRPRVERARAARDVARRLDLDGLLDRRPAELSGGQRQRVAMGRALVRRPRVFLMDEPLSNLDARLRNDVRAELIALQRELEVTTVYVTHDQVEALTMAQRVAVMRAGRLQQCDTPEVVFAAPANVFVAGFVGAPPMNLVAGNLVEDDGRWVADTGFARFPVAIDLPATSRSAFGPCVVGLRPERLAQTSSETDNAFESRVEVVEFLGGDLHVHSRPTRGVRVDGPFLGRERLIHSHRLDDGPAPVIGDTIRLAATPSAVHVFAGPSDADALSWSAIGRGAPAGAVVEEHR